IPDQRNEPADKPIVVFTERPAGTPVAVKAWFYPGESIGNEFIYPKRQAMEIARRTHESVLASASDSGKIERSTNVARVNDSGDTAVVAQSTPPPTADSNLTIGTSGTSAAAAPARTTRTELPRTASQLPLAALFACCAIAAGLSLKTARSRLERAARTR